MHDSAFTQILNWAVKTSDLGQILYINRKLITWSLSIKEKDITEIKLFILQLKLRTKIYIWELCTITGNFIEMRVLNPVAKCSLYNATWYIAYFVFNKNNMIIIT